MMTSPSPPSLDRCSEEQTARNHGPQPVPPRAVAAQSPFHEVLIEILIGDLAAWLPAPLGQRLAATTSVEEFHQLLGAGILYGWIAHDPCLAQLFLHALDGDPKRAALALAQALSACSDPPPGPALCGDRNLTVADYAPRAALNLGLLLKQQGDAQGAKATYQRAIDSGHADAAPRAAFNLGLLLEQQGDAQGARAAYQRAIDSGRTDMAPKAAVHLRRLSE